LKIILAAFYFRNNFIKSVFIKNHVLFFSRFDIFLLFGFAPAGMINITIPEISAITENNQRKNDQKDSIFFKKEIQAPIKKINSDPSGFNF